MSDETKVLVSVETDLKIVAKEILTAFPDQRVFAFDGHMGAGKTTLIKYFCEILGITDTVTSPTFAIVFEYINEDGEPLYHFDFYRINKIEEAFDLGYEEYFYSGCYCFIEWPGKIPELLPGEYVYILIEQGETATDRMISWELKRSD
jgi:tRNA threonylcarbamoyladenosine biosynthesis protein TsaE